MLRIHLILMRIRILDPHLKKWIRNHGSFKIYWFFFDRRGIFEFLILSFFCSFWLILNPGSQEIADPTDPDPLSISYLVYKPPTEGDQKNNNREWEYNCDECNNLIIYSHFGSSLNKSEIQYNIITIIRLNGTLDISTGGPTFVEEYVRYKTEPFTFLYEYFYHGFSSEFRVSFMSNIKEIVRIGHFLTRKTTISSK